MRRAVVLLLLAAGCGTPCPSTPLSPLSEPPRFVLELTDLDAPRAPPAMPDDGLPIPEPEPDPNALPGYATLAFYADGPAGLTVQHERWIDTFVRWQGAAETYDARDALPWSQPAGRLTLLMRERPSVAGFVLPSGMLSHDLPVPPLVDTDAEALVDLAPIGALALVSHRDGRLSILDLSDDGALLRTLDVSATLGAPVRTGRVAPLGASRAVVGLDTDDRGRVAVVDVGAGSVALFELPGLRVCSEVAALPADATRPTAARVAVLCVGQPGDAPEAPLGAGIALLEATDASPLTLVGARPLSTLFPGFPPSHALVGMNGGWVAVASRGGPDRLDALLAVHLESDEGFLLWQEAWTEQWGPGLGEGAFDPVASELVWPSVRSGLLRFRQMGTRDARLDALPAAPLPACFRLAPRRVRHLPRP
jgi:hypothetical protein